MKNCLFFILVSIVLISCNSNTPTPPKEKCENISIAHLPITTHGFPVSKFDTILCFVNNQSGQTIDTLKLKLSNVRDKERLARSISLPESFTTKNNIELHFNDTLIYKISNFKTDWVPRYCQKFCGYQCTFTTFDINGITDSSGSNIHIKNPSFNYPWEK